jgi:hypothetical protein
MKDNACKISLLACVLACATNTPATARISVKNSASYANAYNQVMAVRQQAAMENTPVATTTSATATLPVMVDDEALARKITNNEADAMVSVSDLENCSMIYPNGLFKWGYPESGAKMGQDSQCVAVVELRDVNSNMVLAQTTLAAGDAMKCNIDMFPRSGWQNALDKVELPADAAPTIEDVEKVLNEEQKQNAGFKIAAAAILSGVAGNMLGPKEAGDTKLLGTGKQQLVTTALAATAGAGVMAASTYSGKVAGDTIKSTAVNAATGAVIGNMAAGMSGTGESVLNIRKCSVDGIEQDCVVGNISTINQGNKYDLATDGENKEIYLINLDSTLKWCQKHNSEKIERCSDTKKSDCYHLEYKDNKYECQTVSSNKLLKIGLSGGKTFDEIRKDKNTARIGLEAYAMDDSGAFSKTTVGKDSVPSSVYFLATTGYKSEGATNRGYAVFSGLGNKLFGYKATEWETLRTNYSPRYFRRNSDGTVGDEVKTKVDEKSGETIEEVVFTPTAQDASDGALVDFQNSARTKATLSGAAAGGALGGFTAYQGAKQEVQERWLSATREYDDSLNNFYCGTGTRYLSKYNDEVVIPNPKQSEQ